MKLIRNNLLKLFIILFALVIFLILKSKIINSIDFGNTSGKIITLESEYSVIDLVFIGTVKENKLLKKNVNMLNPSASGVNDFYEAQIEIERVFKGEKLGKNIKLRYGFRKSRADVIALLEEGDVKMFALNPYLCDFDRKLISSLTLDLYYEVLSLDSIKAKEYIDLAEGKTLGVPPKNNSSLECLRRDKSSYPQI